MRLISAALIDFSSALFIRCRHVLGMRAAEWGKS